MKQSLLHFILISIILSSCIVIPTETPTSSVEDLIQILYASDPSVLGYSIESKHYGEFPSALKQLTDMGPKAIDSASLIAKAISFPRPDSYLAAEALLGLGPDIASTSIPILLDNLKNKRAEVRTWSALILASVGEPASCTVTELSLQLWDSDLYARAAAAIALDNITGGDLVENQYKYSQEEMADLSIPGDEPEGSITSTARLWWVEEGSKINWHPSYGICDP